MTTETTKTAQQPNISLTDTIRLVRAVTRARDAKRMITLCKDSIGEAADSLGDIDLHDYFRELDSLEREIATKATEIQEKLDELCGGDLE